MYTVLEWHDHSARQNAFLCTQAGLTLRIINFNHGSYYGQYTAMFLPKDELKRLNL